jgi:hypothetical protein
MAQRTPHADLPTQSEPLVPEGAPIIGIGNPPTDEPGWRRSRLAPSLAEAYRTVPVSGVGIWRKLLAFAGPGYLVAVGYMDPGNWATDLAGGSRFGYTLLSVILLSNLMAVLLQGLSAKLGIVTDATSHRRAATTTRVRSRSRSGCCARSPSPPATWRRSSAPRSRSICCSASR